MRKRKVSFSSLIKDTLEEDKVFSLTDEINKFCEVGGVDVGAFSVLAMKRSCKNMLGELDDFDREKFFKEFFKLYNTATAPDLRAKNVFHPSSLLEDCPRQLTYDLTATVPTNRVIRGISGQLQRIFDVGTWYHLYFQNLLFGMGLLKEAEVPVINNDKFINGKADGMFHDTVFGVPTVLEIKSMNSWVYKKAVFTPYKKHIFQASLYGRELGAEKIYFLYINKDTSEIRGFLVDLDEEALLEADKKMLSVIDNVKKGVVPPRVCKDRLADKALACPFRDFCFKE